MKVNEIDMKSGGISDKFIELCSKGLSFEQIAEKLNISRAAVLDLSDELYYEMESRESIAGRILRENCNLQSEVKMKTFSALCNLLFKTWDLMNQPCCKRVLETDKEINIEKKYDNFPDDLPF